MKRSSRKAAKPARAAAAPRPSAPPDMSRGAALRLGQLLLWGASLAGIVYGLYRLEPYAHAASSGTWRLQWVKVPAGVPDWVLAEIERDTDTSDLQSLLKADVRTPDLCERLAHDLGKSPWIAKINRISKQPDGVVSVHAAFRQYLTYIVKDGMGFLVDETGVRLPRQQSADSLATGGWILIESVHGRAPDLGRPWSGDDVQAGLRLVKFLYERCPPPLLASLKAVDVSNFKLRVNRRDGELRIRTLHPRTQIVWGLPPGEEYDIESTADRKLLTYLWSVYSRGNQLPDRKVIDLRPKDGFLLVDAP